MRLFRLGIPGVLLCGHLAATLIPPPNLAKRVETADAIVVAKLIRGTTLASGSRVSNDFTLRVDRGLKGNLVPGTDVAAHLEGGGLFVVPQPSESAIPPMYGIWFLSVASQPYSVLSRDGRLGELSMAFVALPEQAPAAGPATTPAAAVANQIHSALQYLATSQSAQPGQFRSLADDFRSLGSEVTLPHYRQFVQESSPQLRAFGIQGLIEANDPDGVKRASAEWNELSATADVSGIMNSLMSYANPDPAAVRALSELALREGAPPAVRQNAVYALRAIHTREALPALVGLLDDTSERVQPYALSGLCLFVRNGPTITPQSVPSMSWLQSREPALLLTPEAQRYCSLGGKIDASAVDSYVSFWKSWWASHRAEIER